MKKIVFIKVILIINFNESVIKIKNVLTQQALQLLDSNQTFWHLLLMTQWKVKTLSISNFIKNMSFI